MASSSALLRLPRELRDLIIAEVFRELEDDSVDFIVDFRPRYKTSGPKRIPLPPYSKLPPICLSCVQLYHEATPRGLSRITPILFNLETTCWMRNWLATSFPLETGLKAIQHLAFVNFHGAEQIKGYELIALCPNLRSLNIMLGDEYSNAGPFSFSAMMSPLSSSANAYECLNDIILAYQLHKLIEIPNLERLEFGFHDWQPGVSGKRALQVMDWLDTEFKARARTVHIGLHGESDYFRDVHIMPNIETVGQLDTYID